MIDPISAAELRGTARQRLGDWAEWAGAPDDPDWLLVRSHQAYVVETMCRALYTLAFGELVSKRNAVEWALSALPESWRALVEEAVARRADATADPRRVADLLAFVEWVATQAEAALNH